MIDSHDFQDTKDPEDVVGNPKAGEEGVGGLTTKDAERSYKAAADQHFQDDSEHKEGKKLGKSAAKKRKDKSALPQIGSIQDDEVRVED